ncbi:hypothetical protein [Nocardia carnea]|uniref:hypothetical protein n=1 Tax=Nocardia carnea TaxID=37328 RepID=UPI0024556CA3|nr:hypothetical protein [Nocardia carnea]
MTGEQDTLLRELWAQVRALRAEVSDLRVEISEMEATVADLVDRADEPERMQLPWPVSLLLLPAALALALIRQLDELACAVTAECEPARKELPETVRETP